MNPTVAFRKVLACSVLALCLGGCAFGGSGDVQQNYVLSVPSFPAKTEVLPMDLKVMPVVVASGLDTTRIALVENDVQMNYLADSKWAEPLPDMLQFFWVEALKRAHVAISVADDNSGAKADRLVQITANSFHAVRDSAGKLTVRVAFDAKVIMPLSRTVVAVDSAETEVEVKNSGGEGMVQALNAANQQAFGQLLPKLVKSLSSSRN